jgi:hypothetical protein
MVWINFIYRNCAGSLYSACEGASHFVDWELYRCEARLVEKIYATVKIKLNEFNSFKLLTLGKTDKSNFSK